MINFDLYYFLQMVFVYLISSSKLNEFPRQLKADEWIYEYILDIHIQPKLIVCDIIVY